MAVMIVTVADGVRRGLARAARDLSGNAKRLLLLAADVLLAPLALLLANLASAGRPPASAALAAAGVVALAVALRVGLHRIKLNAWDLRAVLRSAGAVAAVAAGLGGAMALTGAPQPVADLGLFALMLLALTVGGRIAALHLLLWVLHGDSPVRRVVIYGAGTTGVQLARALARDPGIRAVAFLDDNPALHRLSACGLPIHPPVMVPALLRQGVDRVILAMPSAPPARLQRLAARLTAQGLSVMAVPSFAQLVGADLVAELQPVAVETLIDRTAVSADLSPAAGLYAGRCVVVTGAGGSVGSELCRQLLPLRPGRIVLLELSEVALYTIDRTLREACADLDDPPEILPVLGSAADARLARALLDRYPADVVLHAAAYKHVPLIEANPLAGVENNVEGTRVMAAAAQAAGVGRFVLISTDKAVLPRGIMGATKRMAELIVQDLARQGGETRFAIVRFGNVLGSSGSVLPLFREQIARGGPVTLTHDDVTRYFMTLGEASRLVLRAASLAPPGEGAATYVLDMGRPLRIRDMALRLIEAAGLTLRDAANPEGDIEIVVTGLRPGEKLHEDLLTEGVAQPTEHPRILLAPDVALAPGMLAMLAAGLRLALAQGDERAARALLRELSHPSQPAGERAGAAPPAAPCMPVAVAAA